MKKRFARGLVVGKFSPLHRGHELVIRTAIEQCERAYVLSYSKPEFPGCEPERRARWLAELFPEAHRLVLTDELLAARPHVELPSRLPDNDADELSHRRFCAAACRVFFGTHVDAVFTSEDYGLGFARELTAYFGQTDPTAAVQHVSVDQQRSAVPISGTQIRANGWQHRRFLSPVVRASLVSRVLILGGESAGKSTLACALAEHTANVFVAEYGRELWQERGGQLEYEDLLQIGREQVRREERALLTAESYLFCDTSPLTTLFYCLDLFGRAEPELFSLAERRYDLNVLCDPNIPFDQDGSRRDPAFRAAQHEWYLAELKKRGESALLVRGSVAERVQQVVLALERFRAHGP